MSYRCLAAAGVLLLLISCVPNHLTLSPFLFLSSLQQRAHHCFAFYPASPMASSPPPSPCYLCITARSSSNSTSPVTCASEDAQGQLVVTGHKDGVLCVWNRAIAGGGSSHLAYSVVWVCNAHSEVAPALPCCLPPTISPPSPLPPPGGDRRHDRPAASTPPPAHCFMRW
jgi:hypothetical protein